jgi:hypothetical protein
MLSASFFGGVVGVVAVGFQLVQVSFGVKGGAVARLGGLAMLPDAVQMP